jgi:hypothetical protein
MRRSLTFPGEHHTLLDRFTFSSRLTGVWILVSIGCEILHFGILHLGGNVPVGSPQSVKIFTLITCQLRSNQNVGFKSLDASKTLARDTFNLILTPHKRIRLFTPDKSKVNIEDIMLCTNIAAYWRRIITKPVTQLISKNHTTYQPQVAEFEWLSLNATHTPRHQGGARPTQ